MKTILIAFTLLSALTTWASPVDKASGGTPICYGREYSEQHMASHPNQTVKSMKVKFYVYADFPEVTLLDIDLLIKKADKDNNVGYKPYTSGMVCDTRIDDPDEKKALTKEGLLTKNTDYIQCYIECDGGRATVLWDITDKTESSVTFVNRGFIAYGGCGEEVEEQDSIWLAPLKGGDDTFKLKALPTEYCQQ